MKSISIVLSENGMNINMSSTEFRSTMISITKSNHGEYTSLSISVFLTMHLRTFVQNLKPNEVRFIPFIEYISSHPSKNCSQFY